MIQDFYYSPFRFGQIGINVRFMVCKRCGSLLFEPEMEIHDDFHSRLEADSSFIQRPIK